MPHCIENDLLVIVTTNMVYLIIVLLLTLKIILQNDGNKERMPVNIIRRAQGFYSVLNICDQVIIQLVIQIWFFTIRNAGRFFTASRWLIFSGYMLESALWFNRPFSMQLAYYILLASMERKNLHANQELNVQLCHMIINSVEWLD